MPDALSLAELDDQPVELLPARTVLSLFITKGIGDDVGPSNRGEEITIETDFLVNQNDSELGPVVK